MHADTLVIVAENRLFTATAVNQRHSHVLRLFPPVITIDVLVCALARVTFLYHIRISIIII